MTIIIGSDVDGKRLKELIKAYLEDNDYDVLDVTEGKDLDFVDSTVSVAKEVQKSDDNLGIAIDAYGYYFSESFSTYHHKVHWHRNFF